MRWRVAIAVGVLAGVSTALLAAGAAGERAHVGYPNSIVVLGHSGATGLNSDPARVDVDVPANSWATGSNPAVRSVYLRILESNPTIRGRVRNLARDGAGVADLIGQAQGAISVRPRPELVVVQILDNDIRCDGSDAANYRPFRRTFVEALTILSRGLANARIFVVSSWGRPGTYAEAIKGIPAARESLTGTGVCDLFDAAGNVRAEGVAGLTAVVEGYEAQLKAACALFVHCRFDGGALARIVDDLAYLAPDYGHASVRGHARIAEAAWSAMFDFSDRTPATSTASVARTRRGKLVTLKSVASDLSGIEYKLVPRKRAASKIRFRRYKSRVLVRKGTTIVWRAVDLNGNSEATHSLRG